MFFVFEGADGAGKSTQARLLAEHLRRERGLKVLLLREPGGTPLGERIREILLDPHSGDLHPATEMFLFMAARSHLVRRRILPAIGSGQVVVCDRFLWSTVVYQGIVGGLGIPEALRVGRIAAPLRPTRIFVIDTPPRAAFRRLGGTDRMERKGRTFQEKVRQGFLLLARRFPREAAVIDGSGAIGDVHGRILGRLPRRGWPESVK